MVEGKKSIEEIRTILICILQLTIYLLIDFFVMILLVWYYALLTHVVVQLYSYSIIMIYYLEHKYINKHLGQKLH